MDALAARNGSGPFRRMLFGLGQLRDIVSGITQRAQLAAIGKRDRIIEGAIPAANFHTQSRAPGHHVDGGSLAEILVVRSATKQLLLYG
jgi:hypothetical protein